jgi:hypothetical protein
VQLIGHRFVHERQNLAIQYGIVRRISQIAPQLEKITIGELFVWVAERTEEGSTADSPPATSWTPRCIDKEVLDRLVHGSVGHSLVDFGGYLRRLYSSEIASRDVKIA